MAPAEGDADAALAASGRRGRRQLGWAAVLCFRSRGARGEDASVGGSSRARRKRTVPVVDVEVAAPPAGCEARRGAGVDEVAGKGPRRVRGCCCFLPPPPPPLVSARRQDNAMETGGGGSSLTEPSKSNQPYQARDDHQTTTGTGSTGAAEARSPTTRLSTTPRDAATKGEVPASGGGHGTTKRKASGGVVDAFGPAVGLSVVAAVSMAGLLGGRLWAVACVCAWLVALSRLHQRRGPCAGLGLRHN